MAALQPTDLPNETPELSKRAKWRKLETIADVRLALATVVKRVYDKKLDSDRGAVCVSGLRALGKTMHDSDLESRLAELERKTSQ